MNVAEIFPNISLSKVTEVVVLKSLKERYCRTTMQLISRVTVFVIFDEKYITSFSAHS